MDADRTDPERATDPGEPAASPDTDAPVDPAEGTAPTTAAPWEPIAPRIHRCKDADALAEAAAKRFAETARAAVARHGHFLVVLAGGSTPRGLYTRLTGEPYRDSLPWQQTYFAFGDERCVPPDHPDSNYRMADETLFGPLGIPETRVLRMKGEQPPKEAARRYEVRLDDLFLLVPRPQFDLVLLGIGPDGHTASLFPGTAALDETGRRVVANHVPRLDAWRLTLTFEALAATPRVVFMATGEEKARVVAEAFGGVEHAAPHPCERVASPHTHRDVFVDAAAASRLP